ncbi:MAG: P-loop NTPase fold protein [Verrucomicrobiota bacterium]
MQLRKNPPFAINESEPFNDDKLGHKPSIELLSRLVQSAEQPFVITVEAPWGWGKTKFIERWKAHLAKEKHACLYFNAWENDFVADPLVAFIGELRPIVEAIKGGTDKNSPVRQKLHRLQELGVKLAKKSAPVLIKAAARKALGSETVKEVSEIAAESAETTAELVSETVKRQIERYDEEKNSIADFRKTLSELAEAITSSEHSQKQVVFFVDELDRCRPDFAMTLLERIKHLFNVDRIVFVLAIDREQLRNTVRYLYGSGEHADVYLRRFVDFSFQLPKPSAQAFSELLQQRFEMVDFFKGRNNGNLEHERFSSAFADTAQSLNLDLRTQEQCFTRLNVIFRIWAQNTFIPTDALCVLVGLRVGQPELFENLRSARVPFADHIPKKGNDNKSKEFRLVVEAIFMTTFSPVEIVRRSIAHLKNQMPTQWGDESYAIQRKIELLEHFGSHRKELNRLVDFTNYVSG